MKKNIFNNFETMTEQERESLSDEVKALVFGALLDESETFAEHIDDKKSTVKKAAYFESFQRLAGMLDLLQVLKIDTDSILEEFHNKKY